MKDRKFLIVLIAILSTGFPSFAFAQTYEIYTYGSGNFLAAIFNGIKMLVEGGHIASLIKIVLVVGLIIGVLSPVIWFFSSKGGGYSGTGAESFLALIKTGIIAAVVVYGLMIPRANVAIVDRADPSQSEVVTDVPMVNAFIAYVSSRIGDVVGKQVEDVMVPVDAVRFRKNGVALGAKYLNEILDIEAPGAPAQYGGTNNVSISMVIHEYFERCVFPNFAFILGSNSVEAMGLRVLRESPNILNDLPALGGPFRNPNLYFNVNFDESNPLTCATAPEQINLYWNGIFNNWLKQVNYRLLGGNPDDPGYIATIQELFERYFPNSVGSFQDQIKQIAVLNEVRYAFISFAARAGDLSVKDTLMAHKVGSGWIEAGRLFNRIVQTMRMVIEGFVYGASIFLPVFVAVAGIGAFITFVKINFWLQMWVPFYVILNAFADWQFAKVINDALYNPEMDPAFYGISFETVEAVRRNANLILGYIGAFSWSVPALAWGLLKGGEYAVTHALSTVTSGSGGQQTAQQVGAEVGGASNISMGQVSLGRYRLMDGTAIGSQVGMVQTLTGAEAVRQVVRTFGSPGSYISRVGGSQAIEIGRLVGRGEAYGGDINRAIGVSGIGERRVISEAETFKAVADRYGGVEAFQGAITSRNYTQIGAVLGDYAGRMGLSIGDAARQLGSLMGTREFSQVMGFQNTLGVVGRGGFELSETQRLLSEVARAEQMYQFARWAGYAGGREDFGGMYRGHLSGQAEQTWTLQDQSVVNRLNEMAYREGYGTRFQVGDRVSMAWTFDSEGRLERLTLVRGGAGAQRESLDLTKSIRGIQEWAGRDIQALNLFSARGVIGVNQQGIFNAHTFIGLLRSAGAHEVAFSLARDIAKGKEVFLESASFDPDTGKLASFAIRRGGSMDVEDYTRTQAGWESRVVGLSTVERGVRDTTYDVIQRILERGPITSPSSMWSAAVSGDTVLARRVIEAPTRATREQELQEQAKKFAETTSGRLAKQGVLISNAEYSGEAGGKFFIFGAKAGISHINTEQDNYNRIYGDIRRAQSELVGKLERGEIKKEEFEKGYSNIFQSYASEVDRLVKEMGDKKFGADSMVSRPLGIELSKRRGFDNLDKKVDMDKLNQEVSDGLKRIKDEDLPVGQ